MDWDKHLTPYPTRVKMACSLKIYPYKSTYFGSSKYSYLEVGYLVSAYLNFPSVGHHGKERLAEDQENRVEEGRRPLGPRLMY